MIGPVKGGEHGWPFGAYLGSMKQKGYVEEEYFIEGVASRYSPTAELTNDGKWSVAPGSSAPYKTRILVRRPTNPAKFNGTVLIEWINVSVGYEMALCDPPGLYENGFAFVAVSAQPTGIDGFASNPRGLKQWDPERYGSLFIPDEGVSYDIFTQAARAVGPNRDKTGVDPMGGLEVKKLIGTGASQSGTRILGYANGIQPLQNVFDALIPVICAGASSDFEDAMAHPDSGTGNTAHSRSIRTLVRDDLSAKVLQLNTQTEALYYFTQRQPDTDSFRSWEVAGAPHLPSRQAQYLQRKIDRDGMDDSLSTFSAIRINEVDWWYVFDAAILHIHTWVTTGTPPPQAQPIQVSPADKDYAYDLYGNVLGGIRLPELEVPAAKYVAGPRYPLRGYTVPLPAEQLLQLYPTHEDYVAKITAAANAACSAGFIPKYRAEEYCKMAQIAPIPLPLPIETKMDDRPTPQGNTGAKKQ